MAIMCALLLCAGPLRAAAAVEAGIDAATLRQLRSDSFDSCVLLAPAELTKRSDHRPAVGQLARAAEARVRHVMRPDWLPADTELSFSPLKGTAAEPDRLLCRYAVRKHQVEIAAGEFGMTVTILAPSGQALATEADVARAYRHWAASLFGAPGGPAKAPVDARKAKGYWTAAPVLEDKDAPGKRRWIPWTWRESVRVALDPEGRWLSCSVRWLPDESASMPAGGRGRAGSGWFDAACSEKRDRGRKPGLR